MLHSDSNTSNSSINKVHAVLEKSLGIVAANFFAKNGRISVDSEYAECTAVKSIKSITTSSIMIRKGDNGQYNISVSDPTNSYSLSEVSLEIKITGITSVVSCDEGVKAEIIDNTIYLTVDTENSRGATFNFTVA